MSCRREFPELWRSEDRQDRLAGQAPRQEPRLRSDDAGKGPWSNFDFPRHSFLSRFPPQHICSRNRSIWEGDSHCGLHITRESELVEREEMRAQSTGSLLSLPTKPITSAEPRAGRRFLPLASFRVPAILLCSSGRLSSQLTQEESMSLTTSRGE